MKNDHKIHCNKNYKTLGNVDILKFHKTAFLCSRKCPAKIILRSYDWAIEQREKGACIISGFHSQIEKDVFHYLLKGEQPIILVLARWFMKNVKPEIKKALSSNRLLIITPFVEGITRVSNDRANIRNQLMAELADDILIAYAAKGGNIDKLILSNSLIDKHVITFDENNSK
jgi:predicted Rossmann fold nucleotide-binding protein DprA/Smf involved in DNA uptake